MSFMPVNQDDDYSEDELKQLMALGIIPDKMTALDKQMATAEALRYGKGPEGRDSGRVFTAANPLEFIGHGIEQYKAGKDLAGLRQQQSGLLQQQADARKLYFERLRSQRPHPGLGPLPVEGEETF